MPKNATKSNKGRFTSEYQPKNAVRFEKGNSKGKRFSSTNQPDNPGRKKLIYTVLKESGFSADDIRVCMTEVSFMTLKDICKLEKKPDIPIITRIICRQYIDAFRKRDFEKVAGLISKVLPKMVDVDIVKRMIDEGTDIPISTLIK